MILQEKDQGVGEMKVILSTAPIIFSRFVNCDKGTRCAWLVPIQGHTWVRLAELLFEFATPVGDRNCGDVTDVMTAARYFSFSQDLLTN